VNDNLKASSDPPVGDNDTSVVDVGPPAQVVMAIRLAALNYGLGLLSVIVYWSYFSTLQSTQSLILNQAFSLTVAVWLYYKIYTGRNWARVTLLVLGVLVGLLTTSRFFTEKFAELTAAAPAPAKVQMMVAPVISLIVLWLLFVSPGRHWFRRTSRGTAA
jgi:hypothetical protein